jgi:hypothetical protein
MEKTAMVINLAIDQFLHTSNRHGLNTLEVMILKMIRCYSTGVFGSLEFVLELLSAFS